MKAMKFGGRSLSTPEKMREVAEIITADNTPSVVVLSSLPAAAQLLKDITDALQNSRKSQAKSTLKKLDTFCRDFINGLLKTQEAKTLANNALDEHFVMLQFMLKISFSPTLSRDILSQGEQISTLLFSAYMKESAKSHAVIPALDFMQTDKYGEPMIGSIKVKLTQLMNNFPETAIFITQGSICRNVSGEVDYLNIGGSDYSVSTIAAALDAEVCEIWSDIAVLQNNNPGLVHHTKPVHHLSYDEAAELAYFDEKMLHPASLWPVRHYGIPVKLLNTQQPDDHGTLIKNASDEVGAKVIAARDGISVINIKSSRMLLAYGFLQKILETFSKYHVSVDVIATSEIAVSLTIDNTDKIHLLMKDLEAYGVVSKEDNQSIISVVGNEILNTPNFLGRIFTALQNLPVQLASYGAGKHNISLLLPTNYKADALKKLQDELF